MPFWRARLSTSPRASAGGYGHLPFPPAPSPTAEAWGEGEPPASQELTQPTTTSHAPPSSPLPESGRGVAKPGWGELPTASSIIQGWRSRGEGGSQPYCLFHHARGSGGGNQPHQSCLAGGRMSQASRLLRPPRAQRQEWPLGAGNIAPWLRPLATGLAGLPPLPALPYTREEEKYGNW